MFGTVFPLTADLTEIKLCACFFPSQKRFKLLGPSWPAPFAFPRAFSIFSLFLILSSAVTSKSGISIFCLTCRPPSLFRGQRKTLLVSFLATRGSNIKGSQLLSFYSCPRVLPFFNCPFPNIFSGIIALGIGELVFSLLRSIPFPPHFSPPPRPPCQQLFLYSCNSNFFLSLLRVPNSDASVFGQVGPILLPFLPCRRPKQNR